MSSPIWPLFDARIECRGVVLRPVRESDLADLVAIFPDDAEHDPSVAPFPEMNTRDHRARLIQQGYWRSMGTWTPTSWCWDFVVEHEGQVVGVQAVEAENFPTLRTVDSSSWLITDARGRGIGVAMRLAVLGLAFDHLGAVAAISSARVDNAASLGVSKRVGYLANGVSLVDSGHGIVELQHVRLTADAWRASGLGAQVTVSGIELCQPWFGVDGSWR